MLPFYGIVEYSYIHVEDVILEFCKFEQSQISNFVFFMFIVYFQSMTSVTNKVN